MTHPPPHPPTPPPTLLHKTKLFLSLYFGSLRLVITASLTVFGYLLLRSLVQRLEEGKDPPTIAACKASQSLVESAINNASSFPFIPPALEVAAGRRATCAIVALTPALLECVGSFHWTLFPTNYGNLVDLVFGVTPYQWPSVVVPLPAAPRTIRTNPNGKSWVLGMVSEVWCAILTTQALVCFGHASEGQTGGHWSTYSDQLKGWGPWTGNAPPVSLPPDQIPDPDRLAVGGTHTCVGLLPSRALWCFGLNARGQLGVSDHEGAHYAPDHVAVVEVGENRTVVRVALGFEHTIALLSDGTVAAWGANDFAQLGVPASYRGGPTPLNVPVKMGVRDVVAGRAHSCVVYITGELACFGANSLGQLGCGGFPLAPPPQAICTVPLPGPVRSVSAGCDTTCAVVSVPVITANASFSSTQLWCFGDLRFGNDGSNAIHASPIKVDVLGTRRRRDIASVSVGARHIAVLLDDGTVLALGYGGDGALGRVSREDVVNRLECGVGEDLVPVAWHRPPSFNWGYVIFVAVVLLGPAVLALVLFFAVRAVGELARYVTRKVSRAKTFVVDTWEAPSAEAARRARMRELFERWADKTRRDEGNDDKVRLELYASYARGFTVGASPSDVRQRMSLEGLASIPPSLPPEKVATPKSGVRSLNIFQSVREVFSELGKTVAVLVPHQPSDKRENTETQMVEMADLLLKERHPRSSEEVEDNDKMWRWVREAHPPGPLPQPDDNAPVPVCGVSLAFLRTLRFPRGASTGEVASSWFMPESKLLSCSYAEKLRADPWTRHLVNDLANVFVSHAWSANWCDLMDALAEGREKELEEGSWDKFVWIDAVVVNQHVKSNKTHVWFRAFSGALMRINKAEIVLTPWYNPIAVGRSWCTYEWFVIVDKNIPVRVLVPPHDLRHFRESMMRDTVVPFGILFMWWMRPMLVMLAKCSRALECCWGPCGKAYGALQARVFGEANENDRRALQWARSMCNTLALLMIIFSIIFSLLALLNTFPTFSWIFGVVVTSVLTVQIGSVTVSGASAIILETVLRASRERVVSPSFFMQLVQGMDVTKASASVELDRIAILAMISEHGPASVTEKVKTPLRTWLSEMAVDLAQRHDAEWASRDSHEERAYFSLSTRTNLNVRLAVVYAMKGAARDKVGRWFWEAKLVRRWLGPLGTVEKNEEEVREEGVVEATTRTRDIAKGVREWYSLTTSPSLFGWITIPELAFLVSVLSFGSAVLETLWLIDSGAGNSKLDGSIVTQSAMRMGEFFNSDNPCGSFCNEVTLLGLMIWMVLLFATMEWKKMVERMEEDDEEEEDEDREMGVLREGGDDE